MLEKKGNTRKYKDEKDAANESRQKAMQQFNTPVASTHHASAPVSPKKVGFSEQPTSLSVMSNNGQAKVLQQMQRAQYSQHTPQQFQQQMQPGMRQSLPPPLGRTIQVPI